MAKPTWKMQVGETAPEFRLRATGKGAGRGEPITHVALSDFRGKKNVVLAFVPAAFTPV
ncbi:MAG: redoxin domain-containing protein [Deltaproteobacteria bacterium]|nr:redoxin domain-containing protein [Deltaproteobacteria bacterium]